MAELPILTTQECESIIKRELIDLIEKFGDQSKKKLYSNYSNIFFEPLQSLFSIIHNQLNDLLKHLNEKLSNYHYNANESRQLLDIIEQIETLQLDAKGTLYEFDLIKYYSEVLENCKPFLVRTNGSAIPEDFEKIRIIEIRPIFSIKSNIAIKKVNHTAYYPSQPIGSGSYASVSKFKDLQYDMTFALKKAKEDLSEKELQRFKREFDTMKKLNSPYVIKVYNFDEDNNQYIMEFADFTLDTYVKRNNNSIHQSLRINLVNQVLKGFEYISSKEILHRDISTSNILMKAYDDLFVVKISDFGLVKTKESQLTSKSSEVKGSLNDPDLEVFGFENYSIVHETFALTRLINFIMTGKNTVKHTENKELNGFVDKGLDKNLKNRYQSIVEIKRAFNNFT